jgi:hypothetical protein
LGDLGVHRPTKVVNDRAGSWVETARSWGLVPNVQTKSKDLGWVGGKKMACTGVIWGGGDPLWYYIEGRRCRVSGNGRGWIFVPTW